MCGIAGLVGLEYDKEVLSSMLNTMKRRGPDASGTFAFNGGCLLHSRLAIIDIEGGKQPMTLDWKKEKYTITYNGELYNTDELRTLLVQLGHEFDGHSDTEVVLHAYAQWSDACVDKLNGIFSFAYFRNQNRSYTFRTGPRQYGPSDGSAGTDRLLP